jgi:flavin prenyltransferase
MSLPSHAPHEQPQRIVVGMTGASGTVYGIRLLEELGRIGVETHLIMSKAAELTLSCESRSTPRDVRSKASVTHAITNIAAPISSGSFLTAGMIVAPCSANTLGEIASSLSPTLLTRAADVTLKERRRLVLLVRESPLTLGHIKNMKKVTRAGAIICLPVPIFYTNPTTIEEIVDDTVGRLVGLFGLDSPLTRRWNGPTMPVPGAEESHSRRNIDE